MIKPHGFVFSPSINEFEPLFGKGVHNLRCNYENISTNGLFPFSSQYEAKESAKAFAQHRPQGVEIRLAYLELLIPEDESEWDFFEDQSGLVVLTEKKHFSRIGCCRFLGPVAREGLLHYQDLPCSDLTKNHFKTFDLIDNPSSSPYFRVRSVVQEINRRFKSESARIAYFKIQFINKHPLP